VPSLAGAVYTPFASTVPPSASSTDHFTVVLAVPVTWAAKRTESPGRRSVSVGAVTTTMVWPAGGFAPGCTPS